MRLLDGPRPDVNIALLVKAAVEGKGVLLLPGLHHQVMRLQVTIAQLTGILAVGEATVHWRAYWKSSDQPAAGDHIDHGEFLGHARRRVVQRERVAHHAD